MRHFDVFYQRKARERLYCYITRCAIADQPPAGNRAGQVLLGPDTETVPRIV